MKTSKILAGGVADAIAIGGGRAPAHPLAHNLSDNSSSTTTASTTASATRNISDDGTARTVYDGAKDAVTYIVANQPQGQATGSGFVVSSDGLIVTNEHVIDGAQQVQVK